MTDSQQQPDDPPPDPAVAKTVLDSDQTVLDVVQTVITPPLEFAGPAVLVPTVPQDAPSSAGPRPDESSIKTVMERETVAEDAVKTVVTPPPSDPGVRRGPLPPATTAPGLPERIGRYAIVRELARGGMGVVYVAKDAELGREVALKVMRSGASASPAERQRFSTEAKAAARLQHPNIVGIFDVGEDAGQLYFAMDFVKGESLQARLEREGPLEPREAAQLTQKLAEALFYAHSHAILHRDMKPDNVLLNEAGQPLITDFGLAKDVNSEEPGLTRAGQMMGTPSYMPPEQADGLHDQMDRRADVYALGGTLYAMLTGRPPFVGTTVMKTVTMVLTVEPAPPSVLQPGLDKDLETICLKALEKEISARYGSAQDMADDLGRYLRDEPIAARPPTVSDRVRKWVRRNRKTARSLGAFAAVAAIMGVVGTALFVGELHEETNRANAAAREAERQRTRVEVRIGDAQEEKAVAVAARGAHDTAATLLADALRRKEDPGRRGLLLQALAGLPTRRVLAGHANSVHELVFSPDGKLLATSASDRSIRIWDRTSGALLHTLATERENAIPQLLTWAPNGTRLASISWKHIEIWDVPRGIRIALIADAHGVRPKMLAWSPDGTRLASGCRNPTIAVWNASTGEKLQSFDAGKSQVEVLAYSPDGSLLASGTSHGGMHLWPVGEGGGDPIVLEGHKGGITALAFSPGGGHALLSGCRGRVERTGRLWDVASGKLLTTFTGHNGPVGFLAWAPDGQSLVTGSSDGKAQVWRHRSGTQFSLEAILSDGSPETGSDQDDVRGLAFSSSGRLAVIHTAAVRIWSREGSLLTTIPYRRQYAFKAAWSAHGACLATTSGVRGDYTISLWDTRRHPCASLSVRHKNLRFAAWAKRDERIVTVSRGHVTLWDAVDVSPVAEYEKDGYAKITVSPRGTRLISWGVSSTAALLDGETGEQIATLTELNRSAENIAFGPNGRIAAALGRQRVVDKNELARVRIYDHDGTPVRTLEGHTKGVLNLAFSPDGSRLATCGRDGTVRLWDATSGELQRTLTGLPDTYNEVAWSPDGERIVAGSFRAHVGLWDATNGTELMQHEKIGRVFAWSPDGSMLAQAGAFRDGKLRIWSRDGAELASLTAVVVDELAWSADGSLVAAIARNGMVTVWDGVSAEPALIAPMAGAMAWAPEGARLAIPREGDHAVLIYEGTRLVASLPGHTDTVHSLAWSADGRRLLSASKDKSARVWDIALALAPVSELATLVAERTRLQVDVLTVTPLGGVVEDE